MNLQSVLETIKPKILELGNEVYTKWGNLEINHIHEDNVDITTNFDNYIAKEITIFLNDKYPSIPIHDEEINTKADYHEEYSWSIDPIDGTKYFAKHMPIWGISVALLHKREPILGFIYIPTTKQYYYAWQNGGAYQNDIKLTKPTPVLAHLSTIIFDAPINELQYQQITNTTDPNKWKYIQTTLNELLITKINKHYRVRLLGNACLSFVGLANGLFQEYISPIRTQKSFYDIAAGLAIAKELGFDVQIEQIDDIFEKVYVTLT